MLPSELLITRTKKDRIYPNFVPLDEEHLELANELIEVYNDFTGRKKSEIDEIVEELEQGLNFKRVRGLRTLLERRCTFTSKYLIEPVLARRAVFEAASSRSITTQKERAEVIETVAHNFNVSVEDLEQSLWADHESEVILEEFNPLNPDELLKWYNLSLAQTLLFKSTGMTIAVKGNAPAIFRAIKYFGLMYLQEEGNKVRIEGASSLLKLSERYGTSLAKLLPVIVKSDEWELDAEIVVRRDTPRIYHFIMDSRDKDLLSGEEPMREAVLDFDSSVEQKFYNEFVSLPMAKNWDLIREPDVIFTSKGVLIPDFKFQHKELQIETYFEIVGFWTEDYIKRKLSKLRALPITVLVAIDKNLACFTAAHFDLGLDQPVILYSKKVPIGPVVRYLAAIERAAITKQVERLKETEIELEGVIIPIKEIAQKYKMSQDAVRVSLKNPDYVVFKEVVVRKELLSKIKEVLVAVEKYVEAREIIKQAGLPNADEVLAHLGFRVQWKGLDVNEATITLQ
jgi:predicted nuclease of restriction endonuclease-like RecB superfamily